VDAKGAKVGADGLRRERGRTPRGVVSAADPEHCGVVWRISADFDEKSVVRRQ
jgi:hypothetical protein